MIDIDFDHVLDTIRGLWPRATKVMTAEERNAWRMACGQATWQQCQSALREVAVSVATWPRPAHLRKELLRHKAHQPAYASDDKAAVRAAQRADWERDQDAATQTWQSLSPADRAAHARTLAEQFPGLAFLRGRPITSPGIKAEILCRVWAGLTPDEPDPRPRVMGTGAGPLAEAMQGALP